MSLDKAILHGKEHRKEYRGAKRHFYVCRNHGGCDYCKSNRLHSNNVKEEGARMALKEWKEFTVMMWEWRQIIIARFLLKISNNSLRCNDVSVTTNCMKGNLSGHNRRILYLTGG